LKRFVLAGSTGEFYKMPQRTIRMTPGVSLCGEATEAGEALKGTLFR
jgi:hypothetical protein